LAAAARVLEETRQAMSRPELIDVMATKGYWTSPAGKTPAATLFAAITRELADRSTAGPAVSRHCGDSPWPC
jgi:hypothetical protein